MSLTLANEWKKQVSNMSPGLSRSGKHKHYSGSAGKNKISSPKTKRKKKFPFIPKLKFPTPPIMHSKQHRKKPRSTSSSVPLSRSGSPPNSLFDDGFLNDGKTAAKYCELVNNPICAWIFVFFLFYLLSWFVIFVIWNDAEKRVEESHIHYPHMPSEMGNHLPKAIAQQSQVLQELKLTNNKNNNNNNKQNGLSQLIAKSQPQIQAISIENQETHSQSQSQSLHKKPIKNVAISILVTKDPGIEGGFLDSAGALTMSIEEAHSIHNITLIALVHKSVKYCLPILEALGYEIRQYDIPFQSSEVLNKQIGTEMETDGCCGLLELLKLYVWTWTEFDVVLAIDADVHFHRNFDELFELQTTLGWTHGATAHLNQELMNGGYLVVKPKPHGVAHFDAMIALLKEGDFSGRGWKNSGIGWVYGGRTIQGILPYYYLKVAVGDETEFDRCTYNNMVEIDECRSKDWHFANVTSNHFTWCQKPWYCRWKQGYQLCDDFRESWWRRSRALEAKLGLAPRENCPKWKYQYLQYYESPFMAAYFAEHGLPTTKPKLPANFNQKKKH